ncbi:glycosyltransferase family 4 protein [Altererythrobacter aquiaggeris]|uniref:glycosyltransferase family 4 protein n=1 Tax=Aestuarierythrobacter aquiaggeris TaxID=1898396 RepID=UPI00301AE8A8
MPNKARVLVVTERFPPDVHGGAELSLASVLQKIDPSRYLVDLLVLNARETKIESGADFGTNQIIRIRGEADWPEGLARAHQVLAQMPPPVRAIYRPAILAKVAFGFVFSKSNEKRRRLQQLRLHLRYRGKQNPGFIFDQNVSAQNNQPAREAMADYLQQHKPALIHADNFDAIMFVLSLHLPDIPVVSMVRDHRFFCAHPGQQMNVEGTACTNCRRECVSERGKIFRAMLKQEMQVSISERQTALAHSARVTCTSQFLASQIAAMGLGVPVEAVGNPHPEVEDIAVGPVGLNRMAGSRILFIGALQDRKGPKLLVSAFAIIAAAFPDARIQFAGAGPAKPELEQQLASAGLTGRSEFLGFLGRKSMLRAIEQASIVVTPTIWPEPFGRVPLEAGLMGRPVIASDLGGHRETIIDGVTGILVEPSDPAQLAAAISGLLADPQRMHDMGEAAKRHISANFNPGVAARKLMAQWQLEISKGINGE